MPDPAEDIFDALFDGHVEFEPQSPLDEVLSKLPGRWCVYCFADGERRPVQLLCVKNLRASVRRRLGGVAEIDEPSRRINYREVIRHVYFRRVDGSLEQDLLYLDAARRLFPSQYRALVPDRPAWFICVDPDAMHPRFRVVSDPQIPADSDPSRRGVAGTSLGNDPRSATVRLFGPMSEKQDATALVESLEDLFDLCRYHHLLMQSPDARACPYKDMGRCPAPCDGSITLDGYRALVRLAIRFLDDPGTMIRQHELRMRQAADELLFELAGSLRKLVEQMKSLTRGPYRLLRRMESLAFVALQRGPRAKTFKLFLITPGSCEHELSLLVRGSELDGEVGGKRDAGVVGDRGSDVGNEKGAGVASRRGAGSDRRRGAGVASTRSAGVEEMVGGRLGSVVGSVLATRERLPRLPRDARAVDRLACAVQHLLSAKTTARFIPLTGLDERSLAAALRELLKAPSEPEAAPDDEGVVREGATA